MPGLGKRWYLRVAFFLSLWAVGLVWADALFAEEPARLKRGMVVTDHPEASRIGAAVLSEGGNAFDATVAVHFALAVAYPGAGNIGGGGFAVFRRPGGELGSLDFRERAPAAATRDMYLDAAGQVVPRLSLDGHLAVGVPGSVDGMVRLHRRFGSLPWTKLVQPAIDLARAGVELSVREARRLNRQREALLRLNSEPPYLVKPQGKWRPGERFYPLQLAKTLELIRDRGREGFYAGPTAELLVREMERGGGIISLADLEAYQAIWRRPLSLTYRGYRITSMPPPSSGGIALLQLLKGIEPFAPSKLGFNTSDTIHLMTELERRVYADRAAYLGDADFFPVPVTRLLDPAYIRKRMADIDPNRKSDSRQIGPGPMAVTESPETTHYSITDGAGNGISVTTTLNSSYGSRVVVAGAGFVLNNEMDDFSAKPGQPNQFGLIGAEANAIAPGKRMLSSMTPTIVENRGRLALVLGSPGGSTIITTVFQVLLNLIDHGMTLQQAIDAPRVHNQWWPDRIDHQPDALDAGSRQALENLGHQLHSRSPWGRVNAIRVFSDGSVEGAADRSRGDGLAQGTGDARAG